jgi:hypothetical protein
VTATRAPRALPALAALVLALMTALVAQAAGADQPRRMALLVGNNVGSGTRPPLRYAEQDANRLGRLLIELGGFQADDVQVVTAGTLTKVLLAVVDLRARVAAARAQGRHTVVLFYFSGHSDGEMLEIGREGWRFSDLRQGLSGLGAEVRVAIIDSCRSGTLLARKGGIPGPPFDIRFLDDLATSGEAVLTSSAADEAALESRELRGSIFSHHLISGLRGAADTSGDGRVTLNEAYRHAFVNTLLATSATLNGPQHPGYDYSISGRGELVLTEVAAPGALLHLPSSFERILVTDGERRTLMAELTSTSANRIALPPGHYFIQARRQGQAFQARVSLSRGEIRSLAEPELAARPEADVGAKGGALLGDDAVGGRGGAHLAATVGLGVLQAAAETLPAVPSVRMALRGGMGRGWQGELELGSARGAGFRESTLRAGGALFAAWEGTTVRVQAAWRVTGGTLLQAADQQPTRVGWVIGTGPALSAAVAFGSSLAGVATMGGDVTLLRRDGASALALWPSASLGLEFRRF